MSKEKVATCGPKPPLQARALLTEFEAGNLERTFKVLASGTRLRLLHSLIIKPGCSVTELAAAVSMTPQAVSNQLRSLVDKGILANVRNGTNIYYRVIDPCIVGLLDQGLCLTEDTWNRSSRPGLPNRRRTAA